MIEQAIATVSTEIFEKVLESMFRINHVKRVDGGNFKSQNIWINFLSISVVKHIESLKDKY